MDSGGEKVTFSVDLSKAIENIKDETEEVIGGSLFQLFANIVKRTPVGNPDLWKNPAPAGYIGGTLRNSWHCSFDTPSTEGARKPLESGQGSFDSLTATASYKLGRTMYLTNNMPYAYPVEFGWSGQAPQGMVRRSIAEAQKVFDSVQ